MNHDAVIKLVLSTPTLQYTLFRILGRMEMMNVIQRETEEHVQFENSGKWGDIIWHLLPVVIFVHI